MADNKPESGATVKADQTLVKAQERLLQLYQRLEHNGGWRAVAAEVGSSNVNYVYSFAVHGWLPANVREREILLHWQDNGRRTPAHEWINYESGLENAVRAEISRHVGREKAIGREGLVEHIQRLGFDSNERAVREAIKQLRRRSHLICSMPGRDGGYYLAGSLAEFEEFDRVEFGAKIADMNETRQAMRRAAREQFGKGYQMPLLPEHKRKDD